MSRRLTPESTTVIATVITILYMVLGGCYVCTTCVAVVNVAGSRDRNHPEPTPQMVAGLGGVYSCICTCVDVLCTPHNIHIYIAWMVAVDPICTQHPTVDGRHVRSPDPTVVWTVIHIV